MFSIMNELSDPNIKVLSQVLALDPAWATYGFAVEGFLDPANRDGC